MTNEELIELEKLSEAATAGPLHYGVAPEETLPTFLIGSRGLIWCRIVGSPDRDAESDARFFVVARSALPRLIARVRELERDKAGLQKSLDLMRVGARELLERVAEFRKWSDRPDANEGWFNAGKWEEARRAMDKATVEIEGLPVSDPIRDAARKHVAELDAYKEEQIP